MVEFDQSKADTGTILRFSETIDLVTHYLLYFTFYTMSIVRRITLCLFVHKTV